jgi:hypothetical protein
LSLERRARQYGHAGIDIVVDDHLALGVVLGRCPESGTALASQSIISRLENAPSRTDAALLLSWVRRLSYISAL